MTSVVCEMIYPFFRSIYKMKKNKLEKKDNFAII